MAELVVKRNTYGWKIGDHIEAFNERKKELVDHGIAEIVKDDGNMKDLGVTVGKTEEQIKADKRAWYESHFGKKVNKNVSTFKEL